MLVLSSESKGNLYILTSDTGETLILEAGIRLQEVRQALGFSLIGVDGCLVSHAHQDHARYLKEYMNAGIDCYTSQDTIDHLQMKHHRLNVIKSHTMFHIGAFTIVPMSVPHTIPCLAFLIHHQESGKILFATDCQTIPYRFRELTSILVEANYSDEADTTGHGIGAHMALDTALDFIKDHVTPSLRNVVLLHLSFTNSDEREFIHQVKQVAPHADVTVADKDITVNLNIHPF